MQVVTDLLVFAGVVLFGMLLGWAATRRRWKRPRGGGAAVLLGVGHVFGATQEEAILASREETRRKKDSKPGDPPALPD